MKIYKNSNSQIGQESFVLNCLKEKRNGFYVEIGAYHSKNDSNTYLLEKEYGWSGVAFEIQTKMCDEYNLNRSNLCLNVDATKFNYLQYFENNNFPKVIDYLQIDIDPAHQSLKALELLPLDKYRFSVVTFEHDLYVDRKNIVIKERAKKIFRQHGYILAKENAGNGNVVFEDWWIDKDIYNGTETIC